MTISLARWHLLGPSSNAASRVNIDFGCLASLTRENLRLRLLRLSGCLETNKPKHSGSCEQDWNRLGLIHQCGCGRGRVRNDFGGGPSTAAPSPPPHPPTVC